MSTDHLTEALRIAGQCRGFADPSNRERALVVLADEVDRLRGINARLVETSLIQERRLEGERDAARAALDRVQVWAYEALYTVPNNEQGWTYVTAGAEALAAIEGEA